MRRRPTGKSFPPGSNPSGSAVRFPEYRTNMPAPSRTAALHNKSRRTNSGRKYATSIRRSPIWNILVQSALSITLRHDGLLRIVQKDVPNWRLASADCVSGPSLRFVVQSRTSGDHGHLELAVPVLHVLKQFRQP